MTKPHSERGQGRKPEKGWLLQVQIRLESEAEAIAIAKLTPRGKALAILNTNTEIYKLKEENENLRTWMMMNSGMSAEDVQFFLEADMV